MKKRAVFVKQRGDGLKWLLVALIIAMSVMDIAFNVMSFIPVIGPLFETAGEIVLEGLTIMFTLMLALTKN